MSACPDPEHHALIEEMSLRYGSRNRCPHCGQVLGPALSKPGKVSAGIGYGFGGLYIALWAAFIVLLVILAVKISGAFGIVAGVLALLLGLKLMPRT